MATLVLTTVGGAIGGPIGAALGAVLGQAVDRAVFAPPGRQGPRLSDLRVQTSSYGTPIAKVFGTMRVSGSVIWATDLIETRGSARAAKGQPATTTYSYAASFAVALSARPIAGVGRIWADGKLLRGAAGDWKSATGFRLHLGGEGQTADPLIASAEGAAAPAHRGIAYAVFEHLQLADYGNRIPSLTFEVIGDATAPSVGGVAQALAPGVIVGAGPQQPVAGYVAAGETVAAALTTVAALGGAWLVPDGGGMRIADRLDGAVTTLDEDAAIVDTRRPIETVPRTLALSYYDPARDYQVGVQQARRGGGGWRDETTDLPMAMGANEARAAAEAALHRAERRRLTRRATLDATAIGIAPGAAVRADGLWRVTRSSVEGFRVTLDLVPGEGDAAIIPPADAGRGVMAAALLLSRDDGASWEAAGATAAPAVMGALATALPRVPGVLEDRIGTIEVELAHDAMLLEAATMRARDRGANLALVGDELVQFGAAEQLAPRRWRLSRLWRARRGTAAAAHPAGARFVLVEREAMLALPLPGARAGETVRLLASGVGDGGGPVEATATLTGASTAPPSPVRLRGRRLADGSLALSWTRRSRLGWYWRDGTDAPLGEERERYLVTIDDATGTRTIVSEAPVLTLPPDSDAAAVVSVRQQGTAAASAAAVLAIGETV